MSCLLSRLFMVAIYFHDLFHFSLIFNISTKLLKSLEAPRVLCSSPSHVTTFFPIETSARMTRIGSITLESETHKGWVGGPSSRHRGRFRGGLQIQLPAHSNHLFWVELCPSPKMLRS